ncbi:MAG: AMP-binding protein [Gammaproteobacteria bacterium]|nr:AMP-binding protein [Gammaproteobacteria bacterium]
MYPGKWAQEFPDKNAIVQAITRETVTFAELNDRSNQLAQLLWADGLRPGDHVAILMENHLRFFEVVWAALRSGLYLTTINRHLTGEEAGYILDNSEAKLLVTSSYLAEVAAGLASYAPNCERWLMVDDTVDGYESYESAIAQHSTEPLAEEPAGQFMLYSSGTTGRPKGILRPLSGKMINDDAGPLGGLQQTLWGFDSDTVYLSPAPLYHSAPIGFCTATLALGGTVVLMPRFDEIGALQAIEDFAITHSQWVPTMFTRMLKLPEDERSGFDLSSHKVAIHAAAPCPAGIKRQMFDWWGPIIYEYYGGTELNGFTHCNPQEWLAHPGTVGKALLGVIHICDDDGVELSNGEPGLVYFELPAMPFEYLKDPAKTREAQHPEHANWSALGDVGYVDDDGFLYLTDRASFMIISGGVNIYPQEIEDAMILHPKVADVAVIGAPHEEMGEEVKAVVQLADGIEESAEVAAELLDYAREHIAHYKCPRSLDFMDELPRLPTGKLYKRLIKDAYWGKTDSRIV